jgi:hypothetical protein
MRMARGALFVMGKSEGSVDMVMESAEEGGDCWTRQEEMLFTVIESAQVGSSLVNARRTEHNAMAWRGRAELQRLDEEGCC